MKATVWTVRIQRDGEDAVNSIVWTRRPKPDLHEFMDTLKRSIQTLEEAEPARAQFKRRTPL